MSGVLFLCENRARTCARSTSGLKIGLARQARRQQQAERPIVMSGICAESSIYIIFIGEILSELEIDMKFKYFVLLKQQLRLVVIVIVYQDRYGVANVQSLVGVIANLVRTIVGASVHRVFIDSFVFRPVSSAVEWPHVGDDGLDSHSIVVVEKPPLAFGYRNDDATIKITFFILLFFLVDFFLGGAFFIYLLYYMLCINFSAWFC